MDVQRRYAKMMKLNDAAIVTALLMLNCSDLPEEEPLPAPPGDEHAHGDRSCSP